MCPSRNREVFLALYCQQMWDGTIWRLFEVTAPPLSSVPSPHGDIKIEGKELAYKFEAAGYDGPGPFHLKLTGNKEIQLCSAISCWDVVCSSTKGQCSVI